MAGSICDRKPCRSLASISGSIEFQMMGEANADLRILLVLTKEPSPLKICLLYCPFCGMRFDEDLVENMQRAKGAV